MVRVAHCFDCSQSTCVHDDDEIQYFAMRKVYLCSFVLGLRMGQSSDKLSATSSTSFCILNLC